MEKQRIKSSCRTSAIGLKDEDKLTLCALLIKAGYTVRHGRENVGTKEKPKYEQFVEFWEGV